MGAHAEIVLREYLKQNGLTDEEIEQVTMVVIPPSMQNRHYVKDK